MAAVIMIKWGQNRSRNVMSAQVEDQVERERSWRVNAATWSFSKRNSTLEREREREMIHSLSALGGWEAGSVITRVIGR